MFPIQHPVSLASGAQQLCPHLWIQHLPCAGAADHPDCGGGRQSRAPSTRENAGKDLVAMLDGVIASNLIPSQTVWLHMLVEEQS